MALAPPKSPGDRGPLGRRRTRASVGLRRARAVGALPPVDDVQQVARREATTGAWKSTIRSGSMSNSSAGAPPSTRRPGTCRRARPRTRPCPAGETAAPMTLPVPGHLADRLRHAAVDRDLPQLAGVVVDERARVGRPASGVRPPTSATARGSSCSRSRIHSFSLRDVGDAAAVGRELRGEEPVHLDPVGHQVEPAHGRADRRAGRAKDAAARAEHGERERGGDRGPQRHAAAARRGRRGRGGRPAARRPRARSRPASTRASPMSRRRSRGSLLRQRASSSRRRGGVLGRQRAPVRLGLAGSRRSCRDTVSPWNACRPVRHSYSTQPNDQMSERLSTARPRACSGLMYAAVPRITPALVAAGRSSSATPTRFGSEPGRSGAARLGEAEVQHLHRAVGLEHDVAGLQVAVHHARLVRRLDARRDLRGRPRAPRPPAARPRARRAASVSPSTNSSTR